MRCTSALFLLVLSHALAIHLPLPCADANCTSYLQRALDACSSAPCTITLDAGTYALSGAPFNASSTHPVVPRLSLTGAAGVALVGAGAGGGGTTLILDDISTTLYISDSANVSISGLAIDLARVPYTLARVVALAPRAATLEIDAAAYAFDAAARARWPWLLQAQAVTSFDPANRRIPPGATDLFALPPNALAISVLGGPDARGALNLSIATGALRLGDTVIVRHVAYGATGLEAHRTRGLAVRDVSLLAVAGMGVFTELCGDIAIDGLRLERRGGRPMSINADGVHLTNSRGGSVAVRDCVLEGQGDDGLNIVTTYLDVESISADRTQLQLGKWGALFPAGLYPFEVNDTLVFVTRATMQERGAARVAAVSARNGTVTLAAPLPAGAGVYDLIYARECVADAVEVSRNTFSQNRARGALLKARNLVARGNFFNWTSGPAAQAIPDGCSWFEGVTLSNWSFVNNTIVSGDYGGDAERAHVFISASAPAVNASGAPLHGTCAAPAGPPVHAGILVADNSFTVGAGRAAFSVGAATGVVVRNNSVAYADGAPLPPADFVGLGLVDSAAEGNVCAARPGGACVVTGFGAVAPPPAPSFVYVEAADPDALCLDGSRFGVFLCKAATNTSWELAIEGGGWAYDLKSCAERARTPLGSSTTWPAQAPKMPCLNSGTNYIYMQYCDGASFSGYRADPLPAPTNASQLLWFRGARNLAAALAVAREHGLADATNFTMTGSSAGGATTILCGCAAPALPRASPFLTAHRPLSHAATWTPSPRRSQPSRRARASSASPSRATSSRQTRRSMASWARPLRCTMRRAPSRLSARRRTRQTAGAASCQLLRRATCARRSSSFSQGLICGSWARAS